MRRVLVFLMLCGGLVGGRAAWAYDATFTHPRLAALAASQWNSNGSRPLSEPEIAWLAAGSHNEDWPAQRCLNHFYDAVYQRGLTVDGWPLGWPLPRWAIDQIKQSKPLWLGDFTWQRALAAWRAGDRQAALTALGHVLHLAADASVPAHARNNQHLSGDAYEAWVKNAQQTGSGPAFDASAIKKLSCAPVSECLQEEIAFTNKNFFSAGTLSAAEFAAPWQEMTVGTDGYGRANGRVLAWYDRSKNAFVLNSVVHRAYWRELAPLAISYSARLLELFFQEVGAPAVAGEKTSAEELPATTAPPVRPKNSQPLTRPARKENSAVVKTNVINDFWPASSVEELISNPLSRWFPIVNNLLNVPNEFLGLNPPPVALGGQSVTPSVVNEENNSSDNNQDNNTADLPPTPPGSGGVTTTPDLPPPPPPQPPPPADSQPPTVSFISLDASYEQTGFTLNWQGSDDQTPAADLLFDLEYHLNQDDWQSWLTATTSVSAVFDQPAVDGSAIFFRLRAQDRAGNRGDWLPGSTKIVEPNPHNLLLYEGLLHLFHFNECQGGFINDAMSVSRMHQHARWVSGRWDCAMNQSYPEHESTGLYFNRPISASELTLSFYWRDDSNYPDSYSRNRLILAGSQGQVVAAITPTIFHIDLYTNDQEKILASTMPVNHLWHSVVAVWSGRYFALYVDGILQEQLLGDFSLQQEIVKMYLYGENAPSEFDELALWGRALSSEEILNYYNVSKPLKPPVL